MSSITLTLWIYYERGLPPVTSGHKINVHYLLKKCQLLDAVFKETLRLSNGATSARNIDRVTMIAGKKIHAGAKILIPYRQLHYDEDGCLGTSRSHLQFFSIH